MANQIALMEVFRDTQIQIKENEKLRKETRKIQAGSVLYLDQFYAMNAEPKYAGKCGLDYFHPHFFWRIGIDYSII